MKLSKSEIIALARRIRDEHNKTTRILIEQKKRTLEKSNTIKTELLKVYTQLSHINNIYLQSQYQRDSHSQEEIKANILDSIINKLISADATLPKIYNDWGDNTIKDMIILNCIDKKSLEELEESVKKCLLKKS